MNIRPGKNRYTSRLSIPFPDYGIMIKRLLLLIFLTLPLLSGCGNKGPLYLPQPDQKNNG
jgi:hypothetical protein